MYRNVQIWESSQVMRSCTRTNQRLTYGETTEGVEKLKSEMEKLNKRLTMLEEDHLLPSHVAPCRVYLLDCNNSGATSPTHASSLVVVTCLLIRQMYQSVNRQRD